MNIAVLLMPNDMYYYHSCIPNSKTPAKITEILYGLRGEDADVCVVCDSEGAVLDIKLNDTCPGYNYIKAVCAAFDVPMVECLYEGPYVGATVANIKKERGEVCVSPMYQEELKETEAPC